MHDIDRAMFELEEEVLEGEGPGYEAGETFESLESSTQSEAYEMEMAAQLLEISSEEELEEFLGRLVRSATSAARGFAQSAAGQALGGVLKNAARQVLPQVGQIIGNAVVPGIGGQLGQRAGSWLGRQFEFEGLSAEDREFEVAKAFVRVAGDAARAVQHSARHLPPQQAAVSAVTAAARRSLPGLVPLIAAGAPLQRRGRTGRWVRQGNRIVLYGV